MTGHGLVELPFGRRRQRARRVQRLPLAIGHDGKKTALTNDPHDPRHPLNRCDINRDKSRAVGRRTNHLPMQHSG